MNGIDLHNDTDYERGCDGTECDGRFEFVLTGEPITFAALQQWGVESFRANSDASRCFTLGYDPVELRGIECDSTRRPLCQWHCGEKISLSLSIPSIYFTKALVFVRRLLYPIYGIIKLQKKTSFCNR